MKNYLKIRQEGDFYIISDNEDEGEGRLMKLPIQLYDLVTAYTKAKEEWFPENKNQQ